jgi:hypothetical protein
MAEWFARSNATERRRAEVIAQSAAVKDHRSRRAEEIAARPGGDAV